LTESEPGFDTHLNMEQLDEMTHAERSELLDWYQAHHGDGKHDLTKFVAFLGTYRPGALKHYRAYAQALHQSGEIPQVVIALLFLHYYMILGNDRGVLYEVVAARRWGATKQEVLDVIELTFLESGPFGLNAVAELSDEYLSQWPDDEPRSVADPWPAAWRDQRGSQGEAGHYVGGPGSESFASRFFSKYVPEIASAMTARIDFTLSHSTLPPPLLPLFDLHAAVAKALPRSAATAAVAARDQGVTTNQIMATIGFGALYASARSLDEVLIAVAEAFEDTTDPKGGGRDERSSG
jgi:alkylhydroperoxidase/carboxymuconolactone decarboxylase family protein YurZ